MAYAEGTHFVLQAETLEGKKVYIEYEGGTLDTAEARIKRATRDWESAKLKARNDRNRYRGFDSEDSDDVNKEPYDLKNAKLLKISTNPFDVRIWPLDTKAQLLANQLRSAQHIAFVNSIRANSICLVTVSTGVKAYEAEEDSELEVELRKIALEKLSDAEKRILRVKHWDVFFKLGDRSNLDD